ALEATREAKTKRMQEVMQKSLDENRSTDSAESQEFDSLEVELKTIDGDLVRLRKMERIQAVNAESAADSAKAAAENNVIRGDGVQHVQVKHAEKLEPGIAFARYTMC